MGRALRYGQVAFAQVVTKGTAISLFHDTISLAKCGMGVM